jgi:hypothetical protein
MDYISCNSLKRHQFNIFWKKLDQNVTLLSAIHLLVKWIMKGAVLGRFFIFQLK